MLRCGFGLSDVGTLNLSWLEFLVLMKRWTAEPHNAVAEAVAGHPIWTVGEQLAAFLIDAVNTQTYVMRRVNGDKAAKKPKPFPRPWDEKPTTYGAGAIPYDEIDGWIQSTYRDDFDAEIDAIDEWIDGLEEHDDSEG